MVETRLSDPIIPFFQNVEKFLRCTVQSPMQASQKSQDINCFPGKPWAGMGAFIRSISEALVADKALSDSSAAFSRVSGTDRTRKGFSWATNRTQEF